jgi:choline dehydrogenase
LFDLTITLCEHSRLKCIKDVIRTMQNETYDYIIIGAGSAGCVLAERLSADPKNKVLLLEAGGSDRQFAIQMPLGYAMTFSDPRVNWCYWSEADKGLNGRKSYVPRGRVLGGSSSINAMAYLRGLPHDFDDWQAAGAVGWSWAHVERQYDALETRSEYDEMGHAVVHGNGPVWVSDLSRKMHPFAQNFLNAGRDLGWRVSKDLNGKDKEGLSLVRSTVRDGRRWSAVDAFLRPARERSNLHVRSNSTARQILLDGTHATGVEFKEFEKTHRAYATKDVILSAGAINSPQLLQLSGIGPVDLLKSHGIEVKHALNQVGQGFQDHLALSHFYRSTIPTLNNKLGRKIGQVIAGMRYVFTKGGPLTVPVNHATGFVRSHDGAVQPDLQIYANPASYLIHPNGDIGIEPKPGFLLCAQPARPTSRGSVNIASNNPKDAPIIQPNSLSTEEDRQTAIRAGRVIQQLAQTPTIAGLTRKRIEPDIIGMDDDALLENFRNRSGSVFHASCTCRMGRDQTNSVVDARLRVHGLSGLRVVDASVFPNVTSGNTNAPTLMLAAKAAEIILQDSDAQRSAS